MTLNSKVTRAMAQQLDRVNGDSKNRRIAELETQNARLQELLRQARTRIAELEKAVPVEQGDQPVATLTYQGRPATTPARIAAQMGVHVSTVIRRLQAGDIKGEQLPGSNRWIVFTDQSLHSRKKRRK